MTKIKELRAKRAESTATAPWSIVFYFEGEHSPLSTEFVNGLETLKDDPNKGHLAQLCFNERTLGAIRDNSTLNKSLTYQSAGVRLVSGWPKWVRNPIDSRTKEDRQRTTYGTEDLDTPPAKSWWSCCLCCCSTKNTLQDAPVEEWDKSQHGKPPESFFM